MIKSVLVIDDDKILSFLTVNSFKQSGKINDIKVAYDGQEALDLLKKN